MTYLLLNSITAARLLLCPPIWFWCWWKRPTGMVLWMVLTGAFFIVTDHLDGQWARNNGLESELGYWLDHIGDFFFYGIVVVTIVRGSREPELDRRGRKGRGARATAGAPSIGAVPGAASAGSTGEPSPTSPPSPPPSAPA